MREKFFVDKIYLWKIKDFMSITINLMKMSNLSQTLRFNIAYSFDINYI